MDVLDGIQNFLQFINDNWTTLTVIGALVFSIYKKVKNFSQKSTEEKIVIAKTQIRETMLKLVSDAENDYSEWQKAGNIKYSQVVNKVFEKYPALSKVTNQDEIVSWIGDEINNALDVLDGIIEVNKASDKNNNIN